MHDASTSWLQDSGEIDLIVSRDRAVSEWSDVAVAAMEHEEQLLEKVTHHQTHLETRTLLH